MTRDIYTHPLDTDVVADVFNPAPRLCAGCMEVEIPDDKRYCSKRCHWQEDGREAC